MLINELLWVGSNFHELCKEEETRRKLFQIVTNSSGNDGHRGKFTDLPIALCRLDVIDDRTGGLRKRDQLVDIYECARLAVSTGAQ